MNTADRLSNGYQPDFDIDLEVGRQGELFVSNVAEMLALGSGQVEVKTDERITQTGNVYIEYECLRRDGWHPSGIATTKAALWAFVLPAKVLIVAPTETVLALARRHWPTRQRECTAGSHPTRGVVIPVGRFVSEMYQYEVETGGAA